MHVSKRLAFGSAAIAAFAFAAPTLATPGSPAGGENSVTCGDGNVSWDPTNLWPPNHKFQTINISYLSEDDEQYDTSKITVGLITHNQMLEDGTELNGSGHTAVDSAGTGNSDTATEGDAEDPAATTAQVRGERSGREQAGRTYTIQVTCTDYNSAAPGATTESDTADLTVTVPHDQRRIK